MLLLLMTLTIWKPYIFSICATVAPVKLTGYNHFGKPHGISGWLVEGRIYYDAFVINNKKDSILVSTSPTT